MEGLARIKGIGLTTFRDKSLIDYTLCMAGSFKILQEFEVAELDPIFFGRLRLVSLVEKM